MRDFLDEEVDVLLAGHLDPTIPPDDWDLEALSKELVGIGLDPARVSADALWDLGTRDAMEEALREQLDALLVEREATYGEEVWALVERVILLRAIDTLWVEHLTELDDMRRGIGLRGYSGEDPLQAFKKVAFGLYEELRGFIRQQVAHTIFRVSVERQPAPVATALPGPGQPAPAGGAGDGDGRDGDRRAPVAATAMAGAPGARIATSGGASAAPTARAMRLEHGDGDAAAVGSAAGRGAGQPKLGRNEPCWCGSGLKYKKCHGR